MIVILCDGASKGNPGPASIGIVGWIRTKNPKLVYPNYYSSEDIGVKTNMESEWHALLNAVRVINSFEKTEDSYIFCDAQTVVKQVNGIWKVKHDNIKPLYKEFKELKAKLPRLQICWVPRQLVYLADKAAQEAQRGGSQ